jgi:peptidoglycan hydrolase-like protein with peptidoglycan-binding domain
MMLIATAVLASGCAGGPGRKEVGRLQSQLGLLEERVTQLERAGVSAPSAMLLPEPVAASQPASASRIQPRAGVSGTKPASAGPFVKPSTREIQHALKNAGFYQGAIDGKLGPLTREAIREFQRVHGLTDDGIVGRLTWAKLSAYQDPSSGSGELVAAEVLK